MLALVAVAQLVLWLRWLGIMAVRATLAAARFTGDMYRAYLLVRAQRTTRHLTR